MSDELERDSEKSFRERVEEIRERRAREQDEESEDSSSASDEEKSFRERVGEIRERRAREQDEESEDSSSTSDEEKPFRERVEEAREEVLDEESEDVSSTPDEEKSFRERVEEIRERRAREQDEESEDSSSTSDEEKPFRERVGEIRERRAREQDEGSEDASSTAESATASTFDEDRLEVIGMMYATAVATASTFDEDRPSGRHPPADPPDAPDVAVDYGTLTSTQPVGGGGNADVIKATLPTPDGDVTLAIKEPRLSGTGTLHTDQIERMLDEAETWDKLDDHDHVVGVVDYGRKPMPWIAMEYMDSGHLGERSGEMEIPQALWTALAVTKGVRHAHRRGVAHLDLKPENILFRSVEGTWDVPKVADWGLSKHLLQHSKSVEGMSPRYAAPEQFDTERGPADNVTDVYQLGAVFYELFTGQPPFDGRPTQVMRAVMDTQPTPPSEVAAVPDALDEILLTALAKEKEDRYDDILYLRDALRELFDTW